MKYLFIILAFLLAPLYSLFAQNYVSINACSGNFYDSGGAGGNYSNNEWTITTICSNSSNCVVVDFTSFNLESGYDDMYIYDGSSTASPLIGVYTGTNSPGTITSTTGCLTFDFASDFSATRAGWAATISCVPCPPAPPTNCLGGTTICSDNTFSGNSSGYGVQELNASNRGCLADDENQSSWYFFQATTAGTIEFTISPSNTSDDYDFAVWGPYPSTSTPGDICPPSTTPLRCSYSDDLGDTGLQSGAGDNSEGSFGDSWVNPINMNVGDVYILLIDNWSASGDPFDLNINLTNGASLDCVPLPIELMSFTVEAKEVDNELQWQTMAEINNDYFV
ncbi:MAG: CUB domain-containing protein, partial [Flavobacteriales bacterium]|nr:CUB domain-containing protein [Flavobacteriales bacterium]